MTAEIALLNKNGVALAADSAVTVGDGQKIYNTANKLFMLTRFHPVGVMIYGNAELMETPWETIIKTYQREIGKSEFDHLADYGENFIKFLQGFFPEDVQLAYFQHRVISYFSYMKQDVLAEVREHLKQREALDEEGIAEVVQTVVTKHHLMWTEAKNATYWCPELEGQLQGLFKTHSEELISPIFEKLPIGTKCEELLGEIAVNIFCKEHMPSGFTGLVIAGFGRKEIYPSLLHYSIEGVIANTVIMEPLNQTKVGIDITAGVQAFAQNDVVKSFIFGFDSDYEKLLNQFLNTVLVEKYPKKLVELYFKEKPAEDREQILLALQSFGEKIVAAFFEDLNRYSENYKVNPVLTTISALPKEDLAAAAEALVSLTTFKRKVSPVAETVGGPVDVAVISKGDGFVWIKRKMYFRSDVNQDYLERLRLEYSAKE